MSRTDTQSSQRLATPLGRSHGLAKSDSPGSITPRSDQSGSHSGRDTTHRALWATLTPTQRHVLGFVWRYESTGLTYVSIAKSLELPSLPGSSVRGVSLGRTLSDKTLRKVCKALFESGLLVRDGERGAVQLTPLGHELVVWERARRSAGEFA